MSPEMLCDPTGSFDLRIAYGLYYKTYNCGDKILVWKEFWAKTKIFTAVTVASLQCFHMKAFAFRFFSECSFHYLIENKQRPTLSIFCWIWAQMCNYYVQNTLWKLKKYVALNLLQILTLTSLQNSIDLALNLVIVIILDHLKCITLLLSCEIMIATEWFMNCPHHTSFMSQKDPVKPCESNSLLIFFKII